jgi:DNA-binding transcriptional LysR family regulator
MLEEQLGEKMIDRLGREVSATPAGRVFYGYARKILQMRDEAFQALARFKGELSGNLFIAASTIPGTYFLPRLIATFKADHPGVRLTLRISDSAEVARDVLDGSAEAGVIGSPSNDRRLLSEELFADELVLAVSPDHPWAEKPKVDVHELEGQPFIMRESGSGTRAVMTRILQGKGFDITRLNIVAEMGSTEAVRQGVKEGIGISFLSRKAVEEHLDCGLLSIVEVSDFRFKRPLFLVRRKNRKESPACLAFLEYLRERADPVS